MMKTSKRSKLWPFVFYAGCLCLIPAFIYPAFTGAEKAMIEEDPEPVVVLEPVKIVLPINANEKPDIILDIYRNPEYQELVEFFFEEMCGSRELAEVILFNASEFNIPPALAFSLCWEESRYYPRAVNRKNRNLTVDRGLFQLNNATFPNLSEEDFFDPEINARYGLSHLRWCLDHAGTEVAGLAMYNAGTGRVHSGETPKATLDYVSRIMNGQRKIEELFLDWHNDEPEEEIIIEFVEQPKGFTLCLLAPLGRR